MINSDLINFIKKCRDTNISDEKIKEMLLSENWLLQDINEGFEFFTKRSVTSLPQTVVSSPNITLKKNYPSYVIMFIVIFLLLTGYATAAWMNIIPSPNKIFLSIMGSKDTPSDIAEQPSTDELDKKIGDHAGVEMFYYSVVEKGMLETPAGSSGGTSNESLPNLVTIYGYNLKEEKLSKVAGPQAIYDARSSYSSPQSSVSGDNKNLVFTDSAQLHVFSSGINLPSTVSFSSDGKKINIESPVFSPKGDKVAYTIQNQIKVFNKATGQHETIIKDTTVLMKNLNSYFGGTLLPVHWYVKEGKEYLLLQTRTLNENRLPIAVTDFYIYSFSDSSQTPVSFYYAQDKKIQQCGGGSWSCPESPIVLSRSPNGRYEFIQYGTYDKPFVALLDYGGLYRPQLKNVQQTALPVQNGLFCGGFGVWSNDSKRLLCKQSTFNFSDEFKNTIRESIKTGSPINIGVTYSIFDIESKTTTPLTEKKHSLKIPDEMMVEISTANKKMEADLLRMGIKKDSEEYKAYMDQIIWSVYRELEQIMKEQVVDVNVWIGEDTYLATRVKKDEYGDHAIYTEVLLIDLKGNEQSLGVYSVNPKEKIEKQAIVEKLAPVSSIDQFLSTIKKDLASGKDMYLVLNEIEFQYIGSVAK